MGHTPETVIATILPQAELQQRLRFFIVTGLMPRSCHVRVTALSSKPAARPAPAEPTGSFDTIGLLMFHATTVLAVRHRDQTVMASDGQVTFGDTVVKQTPGRSGGSTTTGSWPGSPARPPTRSRCSRGSKPSSNSIAATSSARRRAREGLADRPDAAPPRGDAGRHGREGDLPAVGQRRSDRARRRDHRHRVGRRVCAGGGQGAGAAHRRSTPRQIAAEAMSIAGAICIYSNDKITIEELSVDRSMAIYLPKPPPRLPNR